MADGRYTKPDSEAPAADAREIEAVQIEQFGDRLRLFAARRMRNWAEAEEVAQETIRRALDALRAGRIRNADALPAFLFQTAVHICQQRSRSAGREGRALRRFGAPDAQPRQDDPLASLISAERCAAVRHALDRLEKDDREVLWLTYAEALRTVDIAGRLGLSEGNVRVRRHRALKRLAELLGVTPRPDREP